MFCVVNLLVQLQKGFKSFKVEAQDDVSCLMLARLDALIASMVDGFADFVEECRSQRTCISCKRAWHSAALCNSGVEDVTNCEKHAVVQNSTPKSKKGGRIPVESRKSYKRLLPIAVDNVLCESLMCLGNALDDESVQRDAQVEVVPGANGEDVPDKSRRKHTISFKYSETDHVCIVLKASSFYELVFEWIGNVPDYYVLHFRGFVKAISAFRSSKPLDVINDSDEEDGASLSPKGENMFSSQTSHGLDINAEEDDAEDSIET